VFNARKLPAAEAVLVKGTLTTKDTHVPLLLKGKALVNRGNGSGSASVKQVPAALSVIDGRAKIQFISVLTGKQAKASRVYSLTWQLTQNKITQAKVAIAANSALTSKLCDTPSVKKGNVFTTQSVASSLQSSEPLKATFQARLVTLSTDADPEWYSIYGDTSNAEIAATINAAEAIFEKQLGLRFALVRQHVYVGASPYVSTNPSMLLASFAKNPENPANLGFSPFTFDQDVDFKHLFTGKDLVGNVIGLSYVGAICWSSKNAYGLTQNIHRNFNITTFLHEAGHTFGAAHDTSDEGGIMYPNLGVKRYFSAISVEQINRALTASGKCVSEELVGANLANATLTLKQKRSKDNRSLVLTGALVSNLGVALPGEVVKLTLNDKTIVVMTDAEGSFVHRMRISQIKAAQLTVFAQTSNGEASMKKTLRIRLQ
jgi:hypothetical protein